MIGGLCALDGQRLSGYKLCLGDIKQLSLSGWKGFSLRLKDKSGRLSCDPVVSGIYSVGGKGAMPWMDISYNVEASFGDEAAVLNLAASGLDLKLFALLAGLIPANGHIMVEYESPQHKETLLSLRMGIPAAATPLGALLYKAGFRGGFRDWCIAEGGHEGPQKLQANMPVDREHLLAKAAEIEQELLQFLSSPPRLQRPDLDQAARQRARQILSLIASGR